MSVRSLRSLLAVAIGLSLPLTLLTAQPAAAASTVTVAMAPKAEYYASSSTPTFKATISKAKKGTYAHLQRLELNRATSWKTIKKVKIPRTGNKIAVSFGRISTYRGRWAYRVVSDSSSTLLRGTSPTTYVHLVSCDTTYAKKPPANGTVTAAFSDPGKYANKYKTRRTPILAVVATRTICAAAKNATVNVALWDLSDDGLNAAHKGMVTPILSALDYMAHKYGVQVNFVFDGGSGMDTQTKSWLKQVARINGGTYQTCPLACFSDRAWNGKGTTGDAHQKLITVSKTTKGTPATFVSTTNWSYWQLRDYWNNSVVLWGDQAIYGAVEKRFRAMIASASRPVGTQHWYDVASPNNPSDFGMKKSDSYNGAAGVYGGAPGIGANYSYVLNGAQELPGDPLLGTGVHISFSPQQTSGDTILQQLDNVKCVGTDSVKLTTLFADGNVGTNLVAKINALKTAARGCAGKIQMVISKPIGTVKTQESVYNGLRAALGSSLRCGNFVHTKSTLIKAHDDTSTSQPTTTAITGNRNFNQGGWYDSDETTLRFTAEASDSPAVKSKVGAIFERYKTDFVNIYKASPVCPAYSTYTSQRWQSQ